MSPYPGFVPLEEATPRSPSTSKLSAKSNANANFLVAAGEGGSPQPAGLAAPLRKDIRHLNSRCGVAALFQQNTGPFITSTAAAHAAVYLDDSSIKPQSPSRDQTPTALTPRSHRKLMSSDEPCGRSSSQPRSLGRPRPWSDEDIKPRMAQRSPSRGGSRSPRTIQEARVTIPAGTGSLCLPGTDHISQHSLIATNSPREDLMRSSSSSQIQHSPRWPSYQNLPSSCDLPSSRSVPASSVWDSLVAEAEAVGAGLQSKTASRRQDIERMRRQHSESVRRKLHEAAPAGTPTSPARNGSPALLRNSSWASTATTSSAGASTSALAALKVNQLRLAYRQQEVFQSVRGAAPPPVRPMRPTQRPSASPRRR
eukprot:TRINITY_DN24168_c0_g1_i1.p1 TRINITY_DN24168_c0_g1~~TRINITY_DN24168_c0_g1_i1.p1  ORF type:complete len:389 (+),score=54.17 TRINITY_DN24168_c0_g1_i1:65-1168(+)